MMALDRMTMVDILPDDFTLPENFSVADYFQSVYGARVYPNMKREKVLLKVYGKQVLYFRSLPLHASQDEVEKHEDYSIFSYYLTPDYDFRQDVLSFGDSVEVVEPKELRNSIAETIKKLNAKYK
jgi:predicted DNA-binding transcriptional regulator YafY